MASGKAGGTAVKPRIYRLIIAVSAAAAVGATVAVIAEHRRSEQRRELTRSEYWDVYSDVLADLGGLDGGAARGPAPLP